MKNPCKSNYGYSIKETGNRLIENLIGAEGLVAEANERYFRQISVNGKTALIDVTDEIQRLQKVVSEHVTAETDGETLLTTDEMAEIIKWNPQSLRNTKFKKKLRKGYHYIYVGRNVRFIKERMLEYFGLRGERR
ncbi:hypothetical protein [Flexistipes sp.]|uniref:hypothetical protein n=1 Tax=Flexistipes sp. TaxID=3088135 RepID=UPI002E219EE5|nr:hypothetical protein [Flexistipes sp.]